MFCSVLTLRVLILFFDVQNYRQDCETFRTVVKMLVDKEPSLDGLLQAPLDKNLSEIRQHCLDAIKSFMVELDEILAQPDATAWHGHDRLLKMTM